MRAIFTKGTGILAEEEKRAQEVSRKDTRLLDYAKAVDLVGRQVSNFGGLLKEMN